MSSPNADTRTGHAVWFEDERVAVVRDEPVAAPGDDEVTVHSKVSLISQGTELQVYRGQIDKDTDLGLETCAGSFGFPVKYAYQTVGEVVDVGGDAPLDVGDLVFARHPHQDLFTMRYNADLIFRLPSIDPEVAAFANLADVAFNATLDVPVRIGDVVVVFGQGIVGLFYAMFARRTAGHLIVADPIEERRLKGLEYAAADQAVHPDEVPEAVLEATDGRGADISVEASGAPRALQQAITTTGQEGVIVAISYYGSRPVTLTLAPEFHFRRQRIVSSQVSSLGSGLQPRWDFGRRMRNVLSSLRELPVTGMISHRFSLMDAPAAYDFLDTRSDEALGVLLEYG